MNETFSELGRPICPCNALRITKLKDSFTTPFEQNKFCCGEEFHTPCTKTWLDFT